MRAEKISSSNEVKDLSTKLIISCQSNAITAAKYSHSACDIVSVNVLKNDVITDNSAVNYDAN